MPPGFAFGVEGDGKRKRTAATADDIERSDRELARLFMGMFEVIRRRWLTQCMHIKSWVKTHAVCALVHPAQAHVRAHARIHAAASACSCS